MAAGGDSSAVTQAFGLAGLCCAITAAWFLAFLIPEPSRDMLMGRGSSLSTRCAFIIVVTVASLAARHALSLRNTWITVFALGIGAPIAGFVAFMFGPALVGHESGRELLDARTLRFAGQLILYYLIQCWYVILVLGPATALVLSWHAARSRPGPAGGTRDQDEAGALDDLGPDLRYPI